MHQALEKQTAVLKNLIMARLPGSIDPGATVEVKLEINAYNGNVSLLVNAGIAMNVGRKRYGWRLTSLPRGLAITVPNAKEIALEVGRHLGDDFLQCAGVWLAQQPPNAFVRYLQFPVAEGARAAESKIGYIANALERAAENIGRLFSDRLKRPYPFAEDEMILAVSVTLGPEVGAIQVALRAGERRLLDSTDPAFRRFVVPNEEMRHFMSRSDADLWMSERHRTELGTELTAQITQLFFATGASGYMPPRRQGEFVRCFLIER